MPPMPPPIPGASFSSLGSSTTTASVVVNKEEILQNKRISTYLPSKLQGTNKRKREGKKKKTRFCKRQIKCYQNPENYLAASTKAVLMTFNGSIIPAFTMSTYSPAQTRGKGEKAKVTKGINIPVLLSYFRWQKDGEDNCRKK